MLRSFIFFLAADLPSSFVGPLRWLFLATRELESYHVLGLSGSGRTSYRRHSKSIVTHERGKMFTGDLGDRA